MLPLIWTLFALCTVGGFMILGAYWLDVQDRPDISFRTRVWWSVAIVLFPVVIPAYAFLAGPGWPRGLRIASFLPAVALALFFGFLTGRFS